MQGREVFRQAVQHLSNVVDEALAANGLSPSYIDWLVPHQRTPGSATRSAASSVSAPTRPSSLSSVMPTPRRRPIPLALEEAVGDGRIRPGHLVLMEALGGGFDLGRRHRSLGSTGALLQRRQRS